MWSTQLFSGAFVVSRANHSAADGKLGKQLSMAGFAAESQHQISGLSSSLLTQVMNDMRGHGEGFSEIARVLNVHAQDVQDLMLGIVTFAMQGEGLARSRSTAELNDGSLTPVTNLTSERTSTIESEHDYSDT